MGKEAKDENAYVADVFDAFAERYDRWYDKPFGRSAFKLERLCIEPLCEDLMRPLLEIGVGTGRFAEALGVEYGIDPSSGVLKFAKKRGIEVLKGVGEELPFRDKTFGAVFLIVTLCFLKDPIKVLVESRRVLIDEGSLILGLILKSSPWASFYEDKGRKGNVFYKIAKFYSFREVEAMMEETSFKIVKAYSTIFQPPAEKPLCFDLPREGYYEAAGFVALKAKKLKHHSHDDVLHGF